MDFVQSRSLSSLVLQSSMRRFSLTAILFVFGCVHQRPPELSPSTVAMHRTLAVYRTIAESIYVHTTGRVIAVATAPLDTACTEPRCAPLTSRWGVDLLWWSRHDTATARATRDDLLAHASRPISLQGLTANSGMLFETDPGDVPPLGADVSEWIRFRSTHADAAGALRMSPVGFSPSGQSAIAFVDWRCGPTCGHTLSVALTATNDTTWVVSEMLLLSSRNR
jgi:hypothetical protein